MTKERLDKVLVERRLAESRQKAQALIMAGLVFGDGRRLEKSGQLVSPELNITVKKTLPYVGRGGLKLEEALDVFKVDVAGRVCADIGSSTGGFTDCLLQRGAARVYAVDVDTRQIDRRLREDPRVILIEKNARFLAPDDFPEKPDLLTIDVSFISVLKILPAIKVVLESLSCHPPDNSGGIKRSVIASDRRERGDLVDSEVGERDCHGRLRRSRNDDVILSLIKPQFEAGKGQVGRAGIVRDAGVRAGVLRRVLDEAADIGFYPRGLVRCSTRGQKGNQEYFVLWSGEGLRPAPDTVLQWIEEVTRDEHHS